MITLRKHADRPAVTPPVPDRMPNEVRTTP
jgi:hypothetical protein